MKNKKLEESLGLPSIEDATALDDIANDLQGIEVESYSTEEDQMNEHIQEMNEIYSSALKAHQEILDFGYSCDTKYSAGILNTSSTYLDIALKASKSKIDNKLKQMKFKFDKENTTPKNDEVFQDSEGNVQNAEYTSRIDIMGRLEAKLEELKFKKDSKDTDK